MKISIVTVCLNSEKTILATLNSVLTQSLVGKSPHGNGPYLSG